MGRLTALLASDLCEECPVLFLLCFLSLLLPSSFLPSLSFLDLSSTNSFVLESAADDLSLLLSSLLAVLFEAADEAVAEESLDSGLE